MSHRGKSGFINPIPIRHRLRIDCIIKSRLYVAVILSLSFSLVKQRLFQNSIIEQMNKPYNSLGSPIQFVEQHIGESILYVLRNQSLCYHAHQLNIGQLKFHRIFVEILLKSEIKSAPENRIR